MVVPFTAENSVKSITYLNNRVGRVAVKQLLNMLVDLCRCAQCNLRYNMYVTLVTTVILYLKLQSCLVMPAKLAASVMSIPRPPYSATSATTCRRFLQDITFEV